MSTKGIKSKINFLQKRLCQIIKQSSFELSITLHFKLWHIIFYISFICINYLHIWNLQHVSLPNHEPSKETHSTKYMQHSTYIKVTPPSVAEIEEEGIDLEELEIELAERRRKVWEVCVAHGLYKEGEPNAWEFFIDSTHGLVWCNIFKAASSAWLYNFNLLGKYQIFKVFYFS